MKLIAQENFIRFLSGELERRQEANPSYSLRAFANFLEIHFSNLSKIIKGQLRVGPKLVNRVGEKLGLNEEEITRLFFMKHGEYDSIDSHINSVNKWWHYAILELTHHNGFKSDVTWVAKKLELSSERVKQALEQLIQAEFLEIIEGEWVDQTGRFTSSYNEEKTSLCKKQLQQSYLNRSMQQLEKICFKKRDHSTMVLSIKKKSINEAKREIHNFRKNFDLKFSSMEGADDVYALSISYFPLTNIGENNATNDN